MPFVYLLFGQLEPEQGELPGVNSPANTGYHLIFLDYFHEGDGVSVTRSKSD